MPSSSAVFDLTDANRPIRLRIFTARGVRDDLLLVKHVSGVETMCGGIDYSLQCVSTCAGLALKQFIANPVELQFVTASGGLRAVCGIVAAAAEGQSDGGLATYQLVVRDALTLLDKTSNTRVFRNASEVDITNILLKEFRLANPVAARAFAYDLANLKSYPARAFTMQYNESTGAFLRRLWKRRGIAWFIQPGTATERGNDATPLHTLVLFDDAMALEENAGGEVRFHRDDATEARDVITAWHAVRTLTPGKIGRQSWDYLRNGPTSTQEDGMNDQGDLGNRFAASLDDYLVDAPHVGDDSADYRSLGLARIQRHEYEAKYFQGEGSERNMCVGQWNTVVGHPELNDHREHERKFVVTALHVEAENNLPKTLDDRARRLFALNRWRDDSAALAQASAERGVRYTNRFSCVRRGVPIVPAYDPRTDLPRTALQYVTVVGPVNEEIHCDHLGRVKVRFPGCRDEDHAHAHGAGASNSDRDSAWVQVASPWAGDCYGTISLPRVGDQVLCAFVGGDPDKPLIIGRAHGGRTPPPSFSRASRLPGDRYLSGIVSREGKSPSQRYNQLRMDDTPGEISAQLESVHGRSQLNLGYLTHPRQDGRAVARGQGFELRTDDSGAIRTAKSLLISAWKRLDAAGTHLGSGEHLDLMQDCLDLFKTLGEYVARHQGMPVDAAPQDELKADLEAGPGARGTDLTGDARPTVSLTGPAGIAFSTPKTIVSYAGVNLDTVAQQHMQLASGKRFNVNAGKGISLFSHSDGITQIAHNGDFLLQSQHDNMHLVSAQDIKVTAAKRVIAMAEAEMTFIVSGGAYLRLKGGDIEIGGPGKLTVKTAEHHWNGPANGKTEMPCFDAGTFARTPQLVRATDGKPIKDMQVHILRDGSLGLDAGSDPLYLKVVSQLPLPGVVIFVHGVNSDGEWFHAAEEGLCAGLNTRLARKDDQLAYPTVEGGKLTPVSYLRDLTSDGYLNPKKTAETFIDGDAHFSPVIQFRWGYRASARDMQTYGDALFLNEKNYWGGGPFANGCSSIPDLWEGGLNDQLFLWLHAQHLNPAHDRMVYACPHRGYYVVAALRLAKLIGEIRKKQADVPITIVCHSQGNMVSIAAAFLGDKLGKVMDAAGKQGNCVANTYVLCNPPYSLLKSNLIEGWTQFGTGRQTYEARIGTLANFFEIMKQQAQGHAKPQSVDDIDQLIANKKHGFSAQADRSKHGFALSPEKSNYGRVTLYFNPHDQVISASPVQGIGWRGMSAEEIRDAHGAGVFCQRVFAQGFSVGGEKKHYDFWADHHVAVKNKHALKAGSNQFWYPESLRAQYSVKKGTDANDGMLPKIMTVATAPVFYLFFKTIDVRINGMPDKDWQTPLDAPPLDPPFTPQSMRFGTKSDDFDEGVDAPGSSRNAGRAKEVNDPYASDRPLLADSKHTKQPPETDKAKGNEDTEASLMYEHHATLRMRAKREGLHKNSDANQEKYGKKDSVTEEDDLTTASEGYKAWRAEKIQMMLADTVGTPATDHSTILTNPDHSEKALAYDIPVGVCHIAKEDLKALRRMADWRYLKNLDKRSPVAAFDTYFVSGMMDSKEVADWVGKDGDIEAMLPPKVINKRSLI